MPGIDGVRAEGEQPDESGRGYVPWVGKRHTSKNRHHQPKAVPVAAGTLRIPLPKHEYTYGSADPFLVALIEVDVAEYDATHPKEKRKRKKKIQPESEEEA